MFPGVQGCEEAELGGREEWRPEVPLSRRAVTQSTHGTGPNAECQGQIDGQQTDTGADMLGDTGTMDIQTDGRKDAQSDGQVSQPARETDGQSHVWKDEDSG